MPDATLCNQPVFDCGLCAVHAQHLKPSDGLGFNMIVKNEENCLEETLENIRPIADEIVITDTGSSDRTVEIALQYADLVLFKLWEDSFSKARNWGLQYATKKWICWIDADETIINPEVINPAEWNGVKTLLCPIHSDMPNGQIARHFLPKIFRRNTAKFQGIVHNQLQYADPALSTDITFRHSGYNESPEIMKRKQARTIRLLEKQLTDDPDNTFALMNLGRSLLNNGCPERAYAVTERGLSLERGNTPIRQMMLYNRVLCEIQKGDLDSALKTLHDALTLNPHHLDFLFLHAQIAFLQERWLDCILALGVYRFQQMCQHTDASMNNMLIDYWDAGVRVPVMLGHCYANLGHYLEAKGAFRDALLMDTSDASVWQGYVMACEALGDTEALEAVIAECSERGIVV